MSSENYVLATNEEYVLDQIDECRNILKCIHDTDQIGKAAYEHRLKRFEGYLDAIRRAPKSESVEPDNESR